MKVKKEPLAE